MVSCKSALPISAFTKVLNIRGGSDDNSAIDWRFFVAGGVCAACSHGITTPIDVIKTKMQTSPEKYNKGVIQAARDIIATEGPAFLLAGLAPTVVGYGLEGALKFGFYETFKKLFSNLSSNVFANFLMASVVAGAIASIVLCPMEESRIKMVGESSWAKENLLSGMSRLIRESGFFATFSGLPAMLAKQVPYTMSKQVSFDIFSGLFYSMVSTANKEALKWHISIASAFLTSILACVFSQPGDMILTETYKSKDNLGIASIIANIYRKHGLLGFFIGLQARLAHVASIITSQLVLYDIIKLALGLQATGSH